MAAIPLQDEALLEKFHVRPLAKWPASPFFPDPARYFSGARKWMADRIYPITEASILKGNFLFFVLHAPPHPRVVLGRNGFIFFNGINEENLNSSFEQECCCILIFQRLWRNSKSPCA
jgi:hypothetical protein